MKNTFNHTLLQKFNEPDTLVFSTSDKTINNELTFNNQKFFFVKQISENGLYINTYINYLPDSDHNYELKNANLQYWKIPTFYKVTNNGYENFAASENVDLNPKNILKKKIVQAKSGILNINLKNIWKYVANIKKEIKYNFAFANLDELNAHFASLNNLPNLVFEKFNLKYGKYLFNVADPYVFHFTYDVVLESYLTYFYNISKTENIFLKIEKKHNAEKNIVKNIEFSGNFAKLNNLDQWSAGMNYKINFQVAHNGRVYNCIQPHVSVNFDLEKNLWKELDLDFSSCDKIVESDFFKKAFDQFKKFLPFIAEKYIGDKIILKYYSKYDESFNLNSVFTIRNVDLGDVNYRIVELAYSFNEKIYEITAQEILNFDYDNLQIQQSPSVSDNPIIVMEDCSDNENSGFTLSLPGDQIEIIDLECL